VSACDDGNTFVERAQEYKFVEQITSLASLTVSILQQCPATKVCTREIDLNTIND